MIKHRTTINLKKLKATMINLHNTDVTPLPRASKTTRTQYFLQHYGGDERSALASGRFQINSPSNIGSPHVGE
jgi:hypothetical protein